MSARERGGDSRGAALSLRGVRKEYGRNVVADDISLEVEAGEFVTLLGASGSGKTTLLRMIAGFLEPTAGAIEIDGVDITAVPVHKRGIGVVFQNYALFPHMNVLRNVMFPLEMHKVPRHERKTLDEDRPRITKAHHQEKLTAPRVCKRSGFRVWRKFDGTIVRRSDR